MATGADGGRPDRDTVVGWMQRTGNGYVTAAKHFGIPEGTVKTWSKLIARRSPATGDAGERVNPGGAAESDGGVSERDLRASPLSASRARATPGASPSPRMSAAHLTADARERLRTAVLQQLDYLSRADTVDDQKGRADAARALQTLLLTTPDILTFDERTTAAETKGSDEVAALAAALGVKLPELAPA